MARMRYTNFIIRGRGRGRGRVRDRVSSTAGTSQGSLASVCNGNSNIEHSSVAENDPVHFSPSSEEEVPSPLGPDESYEISGTEEEQIDRVERRQID